MPWLRDEAGAEGTIDYHRDDVAQRISELCPSGIDIFFDNDGGPTLELALDRLRNGGRVVLRGATSRYAVDPPMPGPSNHLSLVMVNGRMEGFLARNYLPRYPEAVAAMVPLLRSGRLKSKEDVAVGLRNAPDALARLYSGANIGKQLLRMDDPPA
ncbi:MAG TPA: zinc-binding dehydrogenase [Thermoplasmata archaeon]|nr:zinc-binding dehydrogenase [Thermoplasmata archaeon]